MSRPALTDTIVRVAEPIVTSFGLVIWGLEILQSGRPVVRLYVDTPREVVPEAPRAPEASQVSDTASLSEATTSATIDQCAQISRMLGLALDVEDIFSSAYVLEVSTPGLSRQFFAPTQLAAYLGDTVELSLLQAPDASNGRKKFTGTLQRVEGEAITVTLADTGAAITVQWQDIRKISRVHVFPVVEKPGKKKRGIPTAKA